MLTPQQIAAPGTEHSHQAATFQFLSTVAAKTCPAVSMVFAVPNGADYGGNQGTGARMKAEGLKSGVPDMFWPWAPQHDDNPFGLWVELKRPDMQNRLHGDRSENQVTWHKQLVKCGWKVVTAYGWRAAVWAFYLHATDKLECDCENDDCTFIYEGGRHMPKGAIEEMGAWFRV